MSFFKNINTNKRFIVFLNLINHNILMVKIMEIVKGDFVTRKSYNNDTIFIVLNISNNIYYLKGADVRLYADAPLEDLVKVTKEEDKENYVNRISDIIILDRDEYFYLPGKILHFDGDNDYLTRCLEFYKQTGVKAIGKNIKEAELPKCIYKYLEEIKPDIVIITGHDAYLKKKGDIKNLKNYQNSENFIKSVQAARRYEHSHDRLIIIAGACQSNYEELIKAGANYASSPKRVNIHALDPAIIASVVALTKRNEEIDLPKLLDRTKYGRDGMGGILGNGVMYVGYPRQ